MQTRRRPRASVVILFPIVLVLVAAGRAQAQSPNIIHLQGDDWGWPYYGFMQRWIAAKVAGTCAGGSSAGAPCTTSAQCPGGSCASEFVGDDPLQRGNEYLDPEILLREYPDASRPPLNRLMTPTFDFLATAGNFYPFGHNSASISQPAFAVIMTGLYPLDWVLTAGTSPKTISPVLPEWLPSDYLTLGAGKWQYALSHVTPDGVPKTPWDREVGQGGNAGEGGRVILRPYLHGVPEEQARQGLALQRIKDFIACARCIDPSKCQQPAVPDAVHDSARMAPRTNPATCTPQPFYILFSPFIPHFPYRFNDNCPYFPRDAQQCATEPWKSHSRYCNDPTFDWSCGNYSNALYAALRPTGQVPLVAATKVEYLKHINTFDRAADELMVFLACPKGGTPDCGENLLDNTVFIHRADHGWELRASKGRFTEHGYRTPMILYDPRPGNRLPTPTADCAGQDGCRNDFVHTVDVLATLKDLSGSTVTCNASCSPACSPSCPNACPCPRPDGLSRYEGQSLRAPVVRSCATADATYAQCDVGRQKTSQGIGRAETAWYVLAEVTDAPAPSHFCKLYVTCGKKTRLYDLRSDPNEKANLIDSTTTFCGSRRATLIDLLRDKMTDRGWYNPCFELHLP